MADGRRVAMNVNVSLGKSILQKVVAWPEAVYQRTFPSLPPEMQIWMGNRGRVLITFIRNVDIVMMIFREQFRPDGADCCA